jgi:hypothetical protein
VKQALSVLWQAVVLFIAAWVGFVAGLAVPSLRITHEVSRTTTNIRTYDLDWIVAVVIVYLLLLGIGALRKRAKDTAITATIALVLVVALLAALTQIGIKDTAIYSALPFVHLSLA